MVKKQVHIFKPNNAMNNEPNTEKNKDLFEHPELMPKELSDTLHRWSDRVQDGLNYVDITELHNEVYAIGYTFDSGLDAGPYGLRPIGVELNELEGWED